MKKYNEFSKVHLGFSDIASVTVRACLNVFPIDYNQDSDYYAYLVLGDAEIGSHYTLIKECDACWCNVYDDGGLAFKSDNYYGTYNTLRVYRSGEHGTIIQFLNKEGA